ncbi:amidophosphoribosyltransferase [Roseospira marina]|uniref:Amidophosphoribosyltransferase n=1 Tax=Roseospira marina TaxID=140057 RepID=A0A5M6I6R6_9PROT|nr:glutamine amidotransferase family protein [Roseospira marina]KAA5603508.1 amidophosphoribosyltransferase [Roseospira marina]MBB4315062.1 amidophosphoribosyltransferase [Roseospira marina]MBB5088168.1 amidophosphoribosyltransferase [Roseospira marina]
MCGIVGLFLKDPARHAALGALFAPMLVEMTERGPDSAGIAVYGDPAPAGGRHVVLVHPTPGFDWAAVGEGLSARAGGLVGVTVRDTHAVMTLPAVDWAPLAAWLAQAHPDVAVVSVGERLAIFKEVGPPARVLDRFGIADMAGSHAIGHTRMATESAVTTAGCHPFNTGPDLCLVHNGSLSNHNRLRAWLRRHVGVPFATDNDSEVAAAYLTWRLSEGDTLGAALQAALRDLDGFYTFCVGTRDGFAVLRDPIACKPAVLAETDDWVAMASEYRALAGLPGVETARVWEPEPATVYTWSLN